MKFPHFREQRYGKRRYFPVVAILAAVATLVLLLVIYTSRNLSLARQRLEESMLQEGLMLSRAIEAGSRAGMRMQWRLNSLQTLVEELGNAPKVVYISVIGTDGKILAHTQQEKIGGLTDIDMNAFTSRTSGLLAKTVNSDQGAEIFEIVTRVMTPTSPDSEQSSTRMGRGMMGMGSMSEMMGGGHGLADIAVIQLGMSLSELKQIQQRDIRNAILLFIVLSVSGSAALYFIVFTQNYYAVNEAFQTMKSYTQHVVDSMANGLISLDTHGRIVTMNRQAYHIFDLPQNRSIQEQVLSDILTIHGFDLFQALAAKEAIVEKELTCTTVSQITLPLSLSASILTDNEGSQLGTVLLFRDLRDVKVLQEQIKRAERLASVGQLAAGVAHEIRNPLGALKGFLQYFQRKLDLQEQDRTYLTVMVNEVDRLNSVISNLLEFARAKELALELCDIQEIIQHVLKLIEGDLQAKQLSISVDIDKHLPQLRLDRDQITQVFLNLLINAIQASEPGGQIHIAGHVQQKLNQLELTVTDSGKGIVPDDLPKIFDPFFTTKKRGAGLGLAIAHTIIENHHGEITVESQGKGSAFRIRLPL